MGRLRFYLFGTSKKWEYFLAAPPPSLGLGCLTALRKGAQMEECLISLETCRVGSLRLPEF